MHNNNALALFLYITLYNMSSHSICSNLVFDCKDMVCSNTDGEHVK